MEINFTADVPVQKIADSICENDEFVKSLTRSIASEVSTYDIANELSVSDIAYEMDTDEIAREIAANIDDDDIVRHIDLDDLANAFDMDDLCEKIAENMPDGTASNDMIILTQRVDTLTRTVERLMGVLDWSLDHMRKGIVHVDTNQHFIFGTGIEVVEPKPVWTIEEIIEQEERIVDHHAQTNPYGERPNYL
jgi:hypothetical protein